MAEQTLNTIETEDFGSPKDFFAHHFYVEIPPGSHEPVFIYEDFGLDKDEPKENQDKPPECRCVLARELWTQIRDEARRDFNARLKAQKLSCGQWNTGKVKLEKFLGKELCILAWAAEHAKPEECIVITQKWLALRPEERWWLYAKTAAEAPKSDQKDRGWRKALYCAFSDGANIKLLPQKTVKSKRLALKEKDKTNSQPLFDFK